MYPRPAIVGGGHALGSSRPAVARGTGVASRRGEPGGLGYEDTTEAALPPTPSVINRQKPCPLPHQRNESQVQKCHDKPAKEFPLTLPPPALPAPPPTPPTCPTPRTHLPRALLPPPRYKPPQDPLRPQSHEISGAIPLLPPSRADLSTPQRRPPPPPNQNRHRRSLAFLQHSRRHHLPAAKTMRAATGTTMAR